MKKLFALLTLLAASTLILGQISGPMFPGPGMVGSAPSPFMPTAIPGCQLWLKADAIVGLNDGDLVATWSDLSGLGHDVTAATTFRPTYKTGILNGRAVVRFNGSNNMKSTAWALNQPSTVYLVTYTSSDAADQEFIDAFNGGRRFLSAHYITFPTVRSLRMYAGLFADMTVSTMSNPAVIGGVFSGASSVQSYNGTAATVSVGTQNANGVCVGSYSGNSNYLVGDIAEILAYSSALDVTNRQIVEGYLACRWGLQASLPVGHPYKTACP